MKRFLLFFIFAFPCLAQEIKRPTVDMDGGPTGLGCAGIDIASNSMSFAYDAAGLTTFSTQSVFGLTYPRYRTRVFRTWQTTTNAYSTLTLNVNSSSSGWAGGGAAGAARILYSTDSGFNWTLIIADTFGAGWNQQTSAITLSPTQNLANLRVAICVQGNGNKANDPGSDDISMYDIWTVGATSGQAPGNGSNSGNAHRGIVMIRYRKPLIWRRRELL